MVCRDLPALSIREFLRERSVREWQPPPSHEGVVGDVLHPLDEVHEVAGVLLAGSPDGGHGERRQQDDPDRGGHDIHEEDRDDGCHGVQRAAQEGDRLAREEHDDVALPMRAILGGPVLAVSGDQRL